jgi:hypothetical protein
MTDQRLTACRSVGVCLQRAWLLRVHKNIYSSGLQEGKFYGDIFVFYSVNCRLFFCLCLLKENVEFLF